MPQELKQLKLRCYACEKEDGTWYAHCITLCLDATGSTFPEAQDNLHQVIIDYLKTALEEGWQDDLVPRHSPFSFQATYWRIWFGNSLRRHFLSQIDRNKQSSTFVSVIPKWATSHA
jgi:predicted RNase H-like HicB family nuclease